jgi:hypothetical protein
LRIGSCLLAVVLLGASAMQAGLAEEARSGAHDRKRSALPAEPAVQSRHLGGRRDEVGQVETKFRSRPSGALHPRRLSAAGASDRVVRNAIGMPVAEGAERRQSERHDFPSVGQSPIAGVVSAAGSGTGNLSKAEGGPAGIVRPAPIPAVTATTLYRGTINGTSLVRPGFGPSGVGGPARAVAGISGTTIRPKR